MTRISVVGLRTVIIHIIIAIITVKEAEIFGRLSWGRHRELHASLREGLLLFSVVDKESDLTETKAEAWSGGVRGEGRGPWDGEPDARVHISALLLRFLKCKMMMVSLASKGFCGGSQMSLSSCESGVWEWLPLVPPQQRSLQQLLEAAAGGR